MRRDTRADAERAMLHPACGGFVGKLFQRCRDFGGDLGIMKVVKARAREIADALLDDIRCPGIGNDLGHAGNICGILRLADESAKLRGSSGISGIRTLQSQ